MHSFNKYITGNGYLKYVHGQMSTSVHACVCEWLWEFAYIEMILHMYLWMQLVSGMRVCICKQMRTKAYTLV